MTEKDRGLSRVGFRFDTKKLDEMRAAAKEDGISLTAYFVGLHNSEMSRRKSIEINQFFMNQTQAD